MTKKLQVYYWKSGQAERQLQIRVDGVVPEPGDLEVYYTKVYENEVDDDYKPDDAFAWFNDVLGLSNPLGTAWGQERLRLLDVGHTSMSVGDIVILDNDMYVCQIDGWLRIEWYKGGENENISTELQSL